jgi:hypothetical protein
MGKNMPAEKSNTKKCPHCRELVEAESEFCVICGELFEKNVFCTEHHNIPAIGVCIICSVPFCKKCGTRTDDHYLCYRHSDYEIYEGMARIYGSSDALKVDLAKYALEEYGFHPYIYSRKASPISMGGPEYTLFRASGEFHRQIINELKLMIPCQEVEEAEQILKELNF